jgi:hypothetical protein
VPTAVLPQKALLAAGELLGLKEDAEMLQYEYLIVGGGMTGDAAVRGVREVDRDRSVGIISSEKDPPYNRPPLTKGLWKGKPLSSIWRKSDGLGVTLHLGRTARKLDVRSSKSRMTRERYTVSTNCCSRRVAHRAGCQRAMTG